MRPRRVGARSNVDVVRFWARIGHLATNLESMLVKKQLVFWGLFIFALHAVAQHVDCENVGGHLNQLASADQQIRQEWNLLE